MQQTFRTRGDLAIAVYCGKNVEVRASRAQYCHYHLSKVHTQHNASFSTQKHARGGKHGALGSKARKIANAHDNRHQHLRTMLESGWQMNVMHADTSSNARVAWQISFVQLEFQCIIVRYYRKEIRTWSYLRLLGSTFATTLCSQMCKQMHIHR